MDLHKKAKARGQPSREQEGWQSILGLKNVNTMVRMQGRWAPGYHAAAHPLTALLILANALLKEVGLSLEADDLHPVEGVGSVPVLLATQGDEQPVHSRVQSVP